MIDQWCIRWGVSPEAFRELVTLVTSAAHEGDNSESQVQSAVRLDAARQGAILFRNNVGAEKLANGSYVRWGLANDSKRINEAVKSADLIGIRPRIITPDMIGTTIGQFVSREIKATGWHFAGTVREIAQVKWATIIARNGGDAKIVDGPGSFT